MIEKKKINHCSKCSFEPECACNDWCLFSSFDPCCPNMKPGREQYKKWDLYIYD